MGNADKPLRISVNYRPPDGNRKDEALVERFYCNLVVGGVRLSHWWDKKEDACAAAALVACAVGEPGYWLGNGTPKPKFVEV